MNGGWYLKKKGHEAENLRTGILEQCGRARQTNHTTKKFGKKINKKENLRQREEKRVAMV